MGSFVKKIGREISRPFEQIGDFFVPDIDVPEGPTEEELADVSDETEVAAREDSRAAQAARRRRQQQFAGTSSLATRPKTASTALAGAITGTTTSLRGG